MDGEAEVKRVQWIPLLGPLIRFDRHITKRQLTASAVRRCSVWQQLGEVSRNGLEDDVTAQCVEGIAEINLQE